MVTHSFNRIGRKLANLLLVTSVLGIVLIAQSSAMAATAVTWVGEQPATYSGGNIFSVVGDTVTITAAGTPTYLNFGSGADQLLAVDGVWVVDSSGNAIAGVSSAASGGSVTGTAGTAFWTPESAPAGYGGPAGYSSVNGQYVWLTGNPPGNDGYSSGTFSFPGLSTLAPGTYDFGIDYYVSDGSLAPGGSNTGRAYFTVTIPTNPVPEPSSVVTLALAAMVLAGLMFVTRRRMAAGTSA